jgi:cobalt-zinc-cadmium efflux system membrane fusion protein
VLSAAQIAAAGIVVAPAAPAPVSTILALPGEIRFNDDRTAHVVPKLAGVVTAVHAQLGQAVRRGQLLAVVASSALSEQRSELLAAQKRLALARTTLERERQLWQDQISAEQDYLHAKQAHAEAELAVQNARQKLSALGAGAAAGAQLNRAGAARAVRRHRDGKAPRTGRSRKTPTSSPCPTSAPCGPISPCRRRT